jgi:hypothetical protein
MWICKWSSKVNYHGVKSLDTESQINNTILLLSLSNQESKKAKDFYRETN